MKNELHTYEFEWYNGEEWDECQLYTSYKDNDRVIEEFLDQQKDMGIPTKHWTVQYLGEGKENCGMDYEGGLQTRCF